jgi:heat shock protein HslJ
MRHLSIVLAIGAIAAITAACSATGGASGAPASGSAGGSGGTIEGVNWRLTTLPSGEALADVPSGVTADARFAGGRVTGSGGCNSFTGPAVISGASITVGPLASTEMACDGPAGDVEQVYLPNLTAVASYTATADALTMFDDSGEEILVYAAGSSNPLEGDWNVTGYNNGKEAVVSPIQGTELTATFTGDQVSGSAGCNQYNGSYTLDGDTVTIGPLATTRMACEPDVMDQETAFLTALQTPDLGVEVNGANVTLRDASGATQAVFGPK